MNYGTRYLDVHQFVHLCRELNVETDERELEYYERNGIMFPIMRVVMPDEYVKRKYEWRTTLAPRINFAEWPDVSRVYEKINDDVISDDQLIDSFDREFGRNACLVRPQDSVYRPWNTYRTIVTQVDGQDVFKSTVEHYYSYWQVHQVYFLQQYPDLYRNAALLSSLCGQCKEKTFFRPWTPSKVGVPLSRARLIIMMHYHFM